MTAKKFAAAALMLSAAFLPSGSALAACAPQNGVQDTCVEAEASPEGSGACVTGEGKYVNGAIACAVYVPRPDGHAAAVCTDFDTPQAGDVFLCGIVFQVGNAVTPGLNSRSAAGCFNASVTVRTTGELGYQIQEC